MSTLTHPLWAFWRAIQGILARGPRVAISTRLVCPNNHNTGTARIVNPEFFIEPPLAFGERWPDLDKLTPQRDILRIRPSQDGGRMELECNICQAHWLVSIDPSNRLEDPPAPWPPPRLRPGR